MEFHKKEAIYLQIVEMVCENILTGRWASDEKIPSVRELAVSIEVNPNTVLRAYGVLQEREIIRMQRGVGYFVGESACDEALAYMKSNFIRNDLPLFFRSVKLLGVDFGELRERYRQWEKGVEEDEDKQ